MELPALELIWAVVRGSGGWGEKGLRGGDTTGFSFSSEQDLQFIEAISYYHLLHVHFIDKIIDSFINAFKKFS